MFSHLFLDPLLLLLLLLLKRSSGETYTVEVGENAHLPCSYTLPKPGTLVPVCWGRGFCPLSKCSYTVLSTDEREVTYQKSSRYRLMGNFHQGDVSLTIENVSPEDQGTYCCRVEHAGPMNDYKLNLELSITPAGTTQGRLTSVRPRILTTMKGNVNDAETQTSGTLHDKNETRISTWADEVQKNSGTTTRLGIYIGTGVSAGLALALISSALILKWYSHKKRKLENSSLVTLANLPAVGSASEAADRMRSTENIYTIEENVYEMENSNEYYCYVNSGQPA